VPDCAAFRRAHQGPDVLVLPNAWDVASARVLERAGFPAIATTSAGVAWSLGHPDGERIPRDEALAAIERIARAVRVPVSADVEGGYGDVVATVGAVAAAGVCGVNVEDGMGDGLRDVAEQVELLHAARTAGGDIVINARTDVYWLGIGAPAERLDHALARVRAYRDAGADCVFVPGVDDADTIAALARGAGCPLNVLCTPRMPPAAEQRRLGVARLSLGSGLARAALGTLARAARELAATGAWPPAAADALPYAEADGLLGG
jgi:2-methylisocitrate lyase-like PEP mutase family enzyme